MLSRSWQTNVVVGDDLVAGFHRKLAEMARIARLSWLSFCFLRFPVRSSSRSLIAGVVAVSAMLGLATPAHATTLSVVVGNFFLETLIPADGTNPGTIDLNVINLTDIGLDLDGTGVVAPPIQFTGLTATAFDDAGAQIASAPLGDLAAGQSLNDPSGFPSPVFQFVDTQLLSAIILTGTIEGFTALLADGSVFTAPLFQFTASMLPSQGSTLLAGIDSANISIVGDLEAPATSVPEPGTLTLLAAGLAIAGYRRAAGARRS
jgi:PEP-CTERM motif-containing protein